MAKTVAVDFDGVLHPYTKGWLGPVPDDEPPTPGAREFLLALALDGYRVVVFSTRCDSEEGLEGVWAWLRQYELDAAVDDVTCRKPAAIAYVDDRAVPYTGDFEESLAGVVRLADGRPHGSPIAKEA